MLHQHSFSFEQVSLLSLSLVTGENTVETSNTITKLKPMLNYCSPTKNKNQDTVICAGTHEISGCLPIQSILSIFNFAMTLQHLLAHLVNRLSLLWSIWIKTIWGRSHIQRSPTKHFKPRLKTSVYIITSVVLSSDNDISQHLFSGFKMLLCDAISFITCHFIYFMSLLWRNMWNTRKYKMVNSHR